MKKETLITIRVSFFILNFYYDLFPQLLDIILNQKRPVFIKSNYYNLYLKYSTFYILIL